MASFEIYNYGYCSMCTVTNKSAVKPIYHTYILIQHLFYLQFVFSPYFVDF